MSIGDGSVNGQFTIKKGQGLSQAIRDELGLTQEEANKLGSVWTKIFEQVDKQQDENLKNNKGKIYTGGNNLSGSAKSNYVVQVNQAISFSKEIWAEIVRLVNEKLGKNIVSVEQDENFETTKIGQGSGQTQGAGQVKGSQQTNLSEQAATDAESVKVTVTNETEAFYAKEKGFAQDLAQKLKNVLTAKGMVNMSKAIELMSKITQDNVAYVLEAYPELATDIDEVFRMGVGFDKDEVYKYVLKPLLERAKTLKQSFSINNKDITIENAKDLSLEDMKKVLAYVAPAVIKKTNERIEAKEAQIPQIQQTFDEANNLLAEVANMEPKPEITDYHQDNIGDGKKCRLPDGRFIVVIYDEQGSIKQIYINSNTAEDKEGKGKNEIAYNKGHADYDIDQDNDGYEGSIKTGYDFEKLKALVEKIFGKQEATEE